MRSSRPTNQDPFGIRDITTERSPGITFTLSQCTPNETCGTSPSPYTHPVRTPRSRRCSRVWLAMSAPALHPAYTAPASSASSRALHNRVPPIVEARCCGLPPEKKIIEAPSSARACSSSSASSRVLTGTIRASIPAVA